MIELPNNRLILNGHRIANKNQFYDYLSRKFKKDIRTEEDLNVLSNYIDLKIAIWHAGNFLGDETKSEHEKIINVLSKYGEVKQTGFH